MDSQHLAQLESQIHALKASHASLSNVNELDELLVIIHKPGWTTPAESALVTQILDSINTQTRQLTTMRQSLLVAARTVGTSRAAGA